MGVGGLGPVPGPYRGEGGKGRGSGEDTELVGTGSGGTEEGEAGHFSLKGFAVGSGVLPVLSLINFVGLLGHFIKEPCQEFKGVAARVKETLGTKLRPVVEFHRRNF